MNIRKYEKELELIEKQNNTEYELYPLAVEIIHSTLRNLSSRYVFARRRSSKGQIYYGISSFPDIAIVDKNFINSSKTKEKRVEEDEWIMLKGCLEVKPLGTKLITMKEIEQVSSGHPNALSKDIGQLVGEILWYKNVLYTNGKEWRYLYINEYSEELRKRIIETVNARIVFESEKTSEEFDWWKNFRDINFQIVDKCITNDCLENWKDFIDKINKIEWKYTLVSR